MSSGIPAKTVGPEQGFNDLGRRVVVNNSGSDITKGMIVYIDGVYVSTSNDATIMALPTVAAATLTAGEGPTERLLIAAQDIKYDSAAPRKGVCVEWMEHRVDVSAATGLNLDAGDPLYTAAAGGISGTGATGSRKVGFVVQGKGSAAELTALVYLDTALALVAAS